MREHTNAGSPNAAMKHTYACCCGHVCGTAGPAEGVRYAGISWPVMPTSSMAKCMPSCYDVLALAVTASKTLLYMYGYLGIHMHVRVNGCCLHTYATS